MFTTLSPHSSQTQSCKVHLCNFRRPIARPSSEQIGHHHRPNQGSGGAVCTTSHQCQGHDALPRPSPLAQLGPTLPCGVGIAPTLGISQNALSMDKERAMGFRRSQNNPPPRPNSATSPLGPQLPRFRGCIRCGDREHTHAIIRTTMVQASVLCQHTANHGGR